MKVAQAVLALSLASCVPTRATDLPIGPGEIAAGAAFEDGEPTAALLFTDATEIPLSFGSTTRLFLWKLRPEDFVREDGTFVSAEELARVNVRFPEDTPDPARGSCGRCLAPWNTSPQPIFPGDSCDVPPFGELMLLSEHNGKIELATADELDAETIEEADLVRRDLRMDWPGACACDDVRVTNRPERRYSFVPPIEDDIDEWPFEVWAMHPDGTVAGFREKRIAVIDPDGTRRLEIPRDFPRDLGRLNSAVAITHDGRPAFVVVGTTLDPINEDPYYLLVETSSAVRVTPLSFSNPNFRPHRLLHLSESRFAMLGGTQTSLFRMLLGSFFYDCSVVGARIECASSGEQVTSGCAGDKQRISDIELLSEDRLIGALEQGGLLVGVKNGNTWMLACNDDGTVEVANRIHPFEEAYTGSLAVIGDGRAFLCAGKDDDRAILTADFSGATTLDELRAVTWSKTEVELRSHFAIPCEDFVDGPEPDQVMLVTNARVAAICKSDGTCTTTSTNAMTGPMMPERLEQVPGWTLASFFTERVDPQVRQMFRIPSGRAPELVYGPQFLQRINTAPLVLGADGYPRWIHGFGTLRFNRTESGLEEQNTIIPDFAYPIYDAALDSSNGSFVALSGGDDGAIILRIWEDPPSYQILRRLEPLDVDCGTAPRIPFFRILIETSPGEMLALNECGWMARIVGDEVMDPIEIRDWDDPETEAKEEAAPPYTAKSVTTSRGITWVGGHLGTLYRIHGDRAQRFSLERVLSERGGYENPWKKGHHVDAVRAFCPDRVLFASDDQEFITTSPRRTFRDGRLPIEIAPLDLKIATSQTRRSEFNTAPVAILGPLDHYVILSNRSWSFQYQVPPVRTLLTPLDAIEDRDGILWLGGFDRRLVIGVPEQ